MDKLDKLYYWHIITLAKLKLLRKEVGDNVRNKRKKNSESEDRNSYR